MNVINRLSSNGGGTQTPDTIVLHAIAERFFHEGRIIDAVDFVHAIGLSAHIYVAPGGRLIRQRRDDQVAWHAKGHNQNSLGIEVMVPGLIVGPGHSSYEDFVARIDTPGWLPDDMFDALVWQCRKWKLLHRITTVDEHRALDPGRKRDPGTGFPRAAFDARYAGNGAAKCRMV